MADLKRRLAPLEGIDIPDRWNEIRGRAPRAGFDPEPPRRQPVAVIALAVVLSVVTVGWLATAFLDADDREVARPDGWTAEPIARLGIAIDRPTTWAVEPIDEPVGHLTVFGTAVANQPIELQHPDLGPNEWTGAWDMRGLPPEAVVVIATTYEGGPLVAPGQDDRSSVAGEPDLSFGRSTPISQYAGDAAGERMSLLGGRPNVTFEVWFGSEASTADRAIAERILSSVRSLDDDPPSPSPTVEPEPQPTLDPKAIDLGLGFGICDADSITGVFGTGGSTRVWLGTRTNEQTLRCVPSHRFALAVDIGGDREAEAWIDPIGPDLCLLDCGLTGVVDLDGDGTDELVILFEGGVTPSFGVVDVRPDGRLELMGYADGEAPQGIPGHDPVKLTIGGDEAYSFAVSCVVEAGGPLITQQAVAGVVDLPDRGATVATYSLRLTPAGFAVVSDEVQEGVVPPPSLPQESSLCGLELPPFGSR